MPRTAAFGGGTLGGGVQVVGGRACGGGNAVVLGVVSLGVLVGEGIGISYTDVTERGWGSTGVVDLPEGYLLGSLGERGAHACSASTLLDTVVANDTNGSKNRNDDDDDEEFDDGEA